MKKSNFCIAVCDDVQAELEEIQKRTEEICSEEHIYYEISGFQSAERMLAEIQKGKSFDLLLIDVMMPGLDGMELAGKLRDLEEQALIVFISCNREMAMKGYEVNAVRYLAKPIDQERLREAVKTCYRKSQSGKELFLPVTGSMRKVSPKDIYYIEIAGRKSHIQMQEEAWDTSLSLTELGKLLPEKEFVRCHQSFLVNCSHVEKFRTSSMELSNGQIVPISKHRIKEVRQVFFDYMKN